MLFAALSRAPPLTQYFHAMQSATKGNLKQVPPSPAWSIREQLVSDDFLEHRKQADREQSKVKQRCACTHAQVRQTYMPHERKSTTQPIPLRPANRLSEATKSKHKATGSGCHEPATSLLSTTVHRPVQLNCTHLTHAYPPSEKARRDVIIL